jgi:hypothetical protein
MSTTMLATAPYTEQAERGDVVWGAKKPPAGQGFFSKIVYSSVAQASYCLAAAATNRRVVH